MDFATIRNPFGPSPETLAVSREWAATSWELTSDLSGLWNVPQESLLLGQGSDPIIQQIPRILLPSGTRAVVPVPTYFGLLDSIPGNRLVPVRLSAASGFELTMDAHVTLLETITRIRPGLVWLCSPNNPTGVVIPNPQIEEIADAAFPGLVIVDEAYQEIADPGNSSSALRILDRHANVIVTRTFSKAYGLPDIRVGVAIAHPDIVRSISAHVPDPHPHSLAVARVAVSDQQHIWQTHAAMEEEISFMAERIHGMQNIELGSESRSGVLILRHVSGHLEKLLMARNIRTTDYDGHLGLEGMRFVRLGLLDRARNLRLLAALRSCDTDGSYKYFNTGGTG